MQKIFQQRSKIYQVGGEFNTSISGAVSYLASSMGGVKNLITKIDMTNVIGLTNLNDLFYNCTNLTEISGTIDVSSLTNFSVGEMFMNCARLESLPQFDTSSITYLVRMCSGCTNLVNVPIYNLGKVQFYSYVSEMFNNCPGLSNESLNNIMASLRTVLFNPQNCTLKSIGLSQTQAQTCTTLSNWTALSNAGWTTGY